MGSDPITHSCLRKKRYTHEGAVIAAHRMRKKDGVILTVYHCLYCDGYHLGNQKGIGNRQRAKKLADEISEVHKETGAKRTAKKTKKKKAKLPPYTPYVPPELERAGKEMLKEERQRKHEALVAEQQEAAQARAAERQERHQELMRTKREQTEELARWFGEGGYCYAAFRSQRRRLRNAQLG